MSLEQTFLLLQSQTMEANHSYQSFPATLSIKEDGQQDLPLKQCELHEAVKVYTSPSLGL